MGVNEKFEDPATGTGAQATPAADEASRAEAVNGEAVALGIAFDGFAQAMETKGGRLLLMATKVLLFNFAVFGPLIAMGFLLFS
ncbi:MAG TPA: hypothetical protein VJ994_15910 [Paracoccaceae bacterium]|nr:hypothetical protein [Paracoccaceae bacterium]